MRRPTPERRGAFQATAPARIVRAAGCGRLGAGPYQLRRAMPSNTLLDGLVWIICTSAPNASTWIVKVTLLGSRKCTVPVQSALTVYSPGAPPGGCMMLPTSPNGLAAVTAGVSTVPSPLNCSTSRIALGTHGVPGGLAGARVKPLAVKT